jgi:uncharacterized protein (DUF58 family)
MASSPIFERPEQKAQRQMFARESDAQRLADRLPDLAMEGIRISQTVVHGVHGRRRAGPGETFWQFRQYQAGDTLQQIDWRRSASSDHLFIREREWEAAHTVWLWPDISTSMAFNSHLATIPKSDRALVLMFALAEMLVRAGERTALMGLTTPSGSRKTTARIAEMLAANLKQSGLTQSAPPAQRVSQFSSVVWISDFLDPVETIEKRVIELAANGSTGHLVQVLDPAEETLPYSGRTEFIGVEDGTRWMSDRAEGLREVYRQRLLAHRAALQDLARKNGWSFLLHHTDRPATEPLLKLIMRLRGEPLPSETQASLETKASLESQASLETKAKAE